MRSVTETELASRGRNPARQEASPSLWLGALSRRGPSPGEKTLGEARQAWRAWSLANSSEGCRGPWQAGPWYPGFHCADREHKPLHPRNDLYWFLFGSYRGVVLVLVMLVMTRLSSPKTVFICVPYCVLGFGGLLVRLLLRGFTFTHLVLSSLVGL